MPVLPRAIAQNNLHIPVQYQQKCGEFEVCDTRTDYCAGDIHKCEPCEHLRCPAGTGCPEYCQGKAPHQVTAAASVQESAVTGIPMLWIALPCIVIIAIFAIILVSIIWLSYRRNKRKEQITGPEEIAMNDYPARDIAHSDSQTDREISSNTEEFISESTSFITHEAPGERPSSTATEGESAAATTAAAAAVHSIIDDKGPQVQTQGAGVPANTASIRTHTYDATSPGRSRGGGPASSESFSQCHCESPQGSTGTSAYESQAGAQSALVTYDRGARQKTPRRTNVGLENRVSFPSTSREVVQDERPADDNPALFVRQAQKIADCLQGDSGVQTIDNSTLYVDGREDQMPNRNTIAMETQPGNRVSHTYVLTS